MTRFAFIGLFVTLVDGLEKSRKAKWPGEYSKKKYFDDNPRHFKYDRANISTKGLLCSSLSGSQWLWKVCTAFGLRLGEWAQSGPPEKRPRASQHFFL